MIKADLHTHSYFSDGTSSPEEVAYEAWKAGVKLFALADHDTTDGLERAKTACEKRNLPWVAAVEISTREHDHLHFLGYNFDIQNQNFQKFLAQNRQNRLNRIKQIIRQIADSGVDLTEEDVFSPRTRSRCIKKEKNRSYQTRRLSQIFNSRSDRICSFCRSNGGRSHSGNKKSRRHCRYGTPRIGTRRVEFSGLEGSGLGRFRGFLSFPQLCIETRAFKNCPQI